MPGDGVAHMAHLGGMFFGFFLIRYWRTHPSSNFDFSKRRDYFNDFFKKSDPFEHQNMQRQQPKRTETDMEYNARKQERQAEVDRILDKIRMSGYDSLSNKEKEFLFEASRDK